MVDTVERTHDAAETVKERHLDQETINLGHPHDIAHHPCIIDNIMMCEHYPLGKSGCPGGILHVYHIIRINRKLTVSQFFIGNRTAQPHHIIKAKDFRTCFLFTDVYDIF